MRKLDEAWRTWVVVALLLLGALLYVTSGWASVPVLPSEYIFKKQAKVVQSVPVKTAFAPQAMAPAYRLMRLADGTTVYTTTRWVQLMPGPGRWAETVSVVNVYQFQGRYYWPCQPMVAGEPFPQRRVIKNGTVYLVGNSTLRCLGT
jgi:hypothetical protein